MRLQSLLSILGVILPTHTFTLPQNVTEGIFSVHTNSQGIEIHQKISDFPADLKLKIKRTQTSEQVAAEPIPALTLARRTYYYNEAKHCGCGYPLNPGNCDDAVAALKYQITENRGNGFPSSWSFYVIRGSVVAFSCTSCNMNGQNNMGTADEYGQRLASITASCGRYMSGTFSRDFGDSDFWGWWISTDQGYMQWYPGVNFCGNARNSGRSSC